MELNIKPWTKEGIEEREKSKSQQKDKSEMDSDDDIPEGDKANQDKSNEEEKKEHQDEEKDDDQPHVDERMYEYEAVGVVVHSGGAEGGHYYSYIKDREKGKWFEFNDTQVKPFDLKDLADETFGGESKGGNFLGNANDFMGETIFSRSRNAYFIIYQRKHPQPLETAQLSDPNHEYVKGIPKGVYQHIWDENMLFMKRMYFFDSEYLHFIREFLSLNNFERKLYTNDSSLTKVLKIKKEAAELLGVTKEKLRSQASIQNIDIFDEEKEDIEFEEDKKFDTNVEFDPEKDFKEDQNVGESSFKEDNEEQNEDRILVDTRSFDPAKIAQAKTMLLEADKPENRVDYLSKLENLLKVNPALYIIKFSTLFALKIKEQVKDSFSFISLLQQLNSMYEMHADGCMWLLKYLTYNKHMIVEHLLKNRSEEERENFRALLITAISLVAKNEEKDFFDGTSDEYSTEVILEYNENKDVFFAREVPRSVLIRFMKVFFEEMLDTAREHYKNFEDYFQVLFYFARLGFTETKYLVKAKGIFRLLDFVMNNNPPFHHDKSRKKMGNAVSDPNFRTSIDLLSLLIRSCVTKGIKESDTDSPVS